MHQAQAQQLPALHIGVSGHFRLDVTRPDGSTRTVAEFENLITNIGMDQLGKGQVALRCRVGTGNTTPANTDTVLVNQIAATSSDASNSYAANATTPYYGQHRTVHVFTIGQAAGNLSEIGVGWSTTGATLFSRALIKDGGGSPTTITILSDEVLTVTYDIRMYPPAADATGTITISGTSYAYVLRAASVTSGDTAAGWGGPNLNPSSSGAAGGVFPFVPTGFNVHTYYPAGSTLGATTGIPSGSSALGSSVSVTAYTDGTYYKDMQFVANEASGNASGGIGAIAFRCSLGRYQMSYTPEVPKDNTKVFTQPIRVSWARR